MKSSKSTPKLFVSLINGLPSSLERALLLTHSKEHSGISAGLENLTAKPNLAQARRVRYLVSMVPGYRKPAHSPITVSKWLPNDLVYSTL